MRALFFIFLIAALFSLFGCTQRSETNPTNSTNHRQTPVTSISESSKLINALIDKYGPSITWSKFLKDGKSGRIFTVHLQNILNKEFDRSFLIFGQLKDIKKNADEYLVRFDSGFSSLHFKVYYDLKASPSIVDRLLLLKEASSFYDDFAVVVNLISVKTPVFNIDSNQLDSGGVEMEIGIDKIFIVNGNIIDFEYCEKGFF